MLQPAEARRTPCGITTGETSARVATDHPSCRNHADMRQGRHTPARYRIVVRGRLGELFTALFDGLDCTSASGESTLVGSFDQAGLHGLLDRLRDLGIDLVSVILLDPS